MSDTKTSGLNKAYEYFNNFGPNHPILSYDDVQEIKKSLTYWAIVEESNRIYKAVSAHQVEYEKRDNSTD